MNTTPSIQTRLSRVIITVSLAWSLTVFALVWWAIHRQLDDVLDSALQESAEIMYGLLKSQPGLIPEHHHTERDDDAEDHASSVATLPAPEHDERMAWQLVAADGTLLWRSHRAPKHALSRVDDDRYIADHTEWHVHGIRFDDAGTMLYVAQPHLDRRTAQWRAALATGVGTLLVGLGCALWLQRRVRQELRPLIDLSESVERYQPLAPTAPLPPALRTELAPLRDAIEHLGHRLSKAVLSERAFSAHAAHALRTPLAGLAAQLATSQKTAPPELQPRLQRARDAADRLSRVVTALLALFRTGGEPQRHRVRLADLMQQLPVQGLALNVDGDHTLQAHIDPDLVAGALLNLLDNSVRHGAQHAVLRWRTPTPGELVLSLTDDGPGVPTQDVDRLNQALQHQQYEQNMGLGLMLADRVGRAHQGHLRVLPMDSGFGVELTLQADCT
ncbi:MAG: sensor histidine kinase [Aquabacterium sp.]